jgi:hypothetical protein
MESLEHEADGSGAGAIGDDQQKALVAIGG